MTAKRHPRKPSSGPSGQRNKPGGNRPVPKPPAVATVKATHLDADGFAVAAVEGRTVRIPGLLPGEIAEVRLPAATSPTPVTRIVRLLARSPERTGRPCRYRRECDGCSLIEWDYGAQLTWKTGLVRAEMERYPALRACTVDATVPSPRTVHYRNSAKLVIAGKHHEPVIGIYRRNSHQVVDIEECPLHHPLVADIVRAVKKGIRKGKVPVYDPASDTGFLRYLVIRISEGTGKATVAFVTARRSFNELHHLALHLRKEVPQVEVVVQNVNASSGNVIFGRHDHFLTPARSIIETLDQVRLGVSPRSFFQVNPGTALLIYRKVRELAALTGREDVLDVYCGIGGISLFLSREAATVTGIEFVPEAVADAAANARMNGAANCAFLAGDAAELLDELQEEGRRFGVIVLNPPRKGCERQVLEKCAGLGARRIVYVSCSPATLARDLDLLATRGFAVTGIQPFDMFPHTPHVETVAVLERTLPYPGAR